MPASHAAAPRHSDSAGLGWPVICLPESAEACGHVTPIAQTARHDALRRLASVREMLAGLYQHQLMQRQSNRAASTCEVLRAVTNEILIAGRNA